MKIFGRTLFSLLFRRLHAKILRKSYLLSLIHPLHPHQHNMDSLTDEESLAVVQALGDAVVNAREALATSQAATAEALKYLQPLAEKSTALQAQVDALEAANQKFVDADAALDAALSTQRDRVNPPTPVDVPTETGTEPAGPLDGAAPTPVTDETGAEVGSPVAPGDVPTSPDAPAPSEPEKTE